MVCLSGIAATSAAVFWECYLWFLTKKVGFILKLILGVIAIMVAALATAAGRGVVSIATGQDPQYFNLSVAFLAPIAFIPVLALVLLVLASTIGILGVLILGLVQTSSAKADLDIDPPILMARLFGIIGIIVGAAFLLDDKGWFNRSLTTVAAHSAYLMDMHPDKSCSLNRNDRFVRINDGIVIVGRRGPDAPRFARVACAQTPEVELIPRR